MYKIYTEKNLCGPPGRLHKILLTMKLTVFLIVAAILQVSASAYAQKITLNEKNVPLEQVLQKIGDQSGYNFLYTKTMLLAAKPVNIEIKDASLTEVLNQLFKDQPLQYVIKANAVVIQKKEVEPVEKPAAPSPPLDIIGRVTNTHGQPLDGASVTIKRTQRGTLTDANGNFNKEGYCRRIHWW